LQLSEGSSARAVLGHRTGTSLKSQSPDRHRCAACQPGDPRCFLAGRPVGGMKMDPGQEIVIGARVRQYLPVQRRFTLSGGKNRVVYVLSHSCDCASRADADFYTNKNRSGMVSSRAGEPARTGSTIQSTLSDRGRMIWQPPPGYAIFRLLDVWMFLVPAGSSLVSAGRRQNRVFTEGPSGEAERRREPTLAEPVRHGDAGNSGHV
jgi:hypothetical protein